ncbi:MAG: helix-turn-helix transcriptional regulator [Thermoanaerobaculia bacterium]|nr:helix-turn-helix transcriptional regulator [Thermoanaerobaculia bacterium]
MSLGVPQQHISRVETGDRRIDPAELQAFALLYALPIADLLGNEEDE